MAIRIIPRAVINTSDEIELGKVIYYKPAFADGIAFEVDAKGIATLYAVTRFLNYDLARANSIADIVNKKNETYSMSEIEDRTLILSPASKTLDDIHTNIVKVMERADIERLSILNFTNYNLIVDKFPKDEIEYVLRVMSTFEGGSVPHKIIFDIDSRYINELNQCLCGIDFS